MSEIGTDSLAQQIIEYIGDLRDVPVPEEMPELGPGRAIDRLVASSPGLTDLLAEAERAADAPAPARPGPHGEVKLPDLPDDRALKAKAIEMLGMDPSLMDKSTMPDVDPPAADAAEMAEAPDEGEPPPLPATPAPSRPPERSEDRSAEAGESPDAEQTSLLVAKVNEIIAYLHVRRDIEAPSPLAEEGG